MQLNTLGMKNRFGTLAIILLTIAFCILACGEPEEIIPVVEISNDFELVGKWEFQKVAGDGVIFGVPRSSIDENPTGFVEFLPDGKGFSNFSTLLLDMPFELEDSIVWTRITIDTVLVQAVTEGKMDLWNILMADNQSLNAEWPINIAGNTATINVEFTK